MNTYISASAWHSHPLCPSLKNWWHKKGVTFHTNKARPHHLLYIVRTCLLELCFWILTVTVPDTEMKGDLESVRFGFLIEHHCPITMSHGFFRKAETGKEGEKSSEEVDRHGVSEKKQHSLERGGGERGERERE